MTIKIELSSAQLDQIRDVNRTTCKGISVDRAITDSTSFAFFAAFDGTNNDKDHVPPGELCTNVAQLWDQFRRASEGSARFGGNYYKGPGAPGTLDKSSWLSPRVTEQVTLTANAAYQDFCAGASAIDALDSVAVVITSFSRGCASAAIFAQMLYERGLVHPDTGAILIPPKKVPVVGGVIFDPVMTGVETSLAYPPNVQNVVCLKALNDYRYLFPAADYSHQPETILRIFRVYGNHCDIGGGYDNGIAALTLETATSVLKMLGLPIEDVPAARAYVPEQTTIHSEEYDNYGHKMWEVSNQVGFSFEDVRLTAGIGAAAA